MNEQEEELQDGGTKYIKGIVWIEKSNSTGKNNYSNQVYTSGEDYLLKDASVQLVKKSNGSVYRSTTTKNQKKDVATWKIIIKEEC